MNRTISEAAYARLTELLARDARVLDRLCLDTQHGGLNFRASFTNGERRLHITNDGELLDRSDPDSYLYHYGEAE